MFDKEKALQVLLYVVNRHKRADKHKVFKTLYFAEQDHMARYGAPLLGDTFKAMEYGPVPDQVYNYVQTLGAEAALSTEVTSPSPVLVCEGYVLAALVEADDEYLAESEIECLDAAIEKCKDRSFGQLIDLSHDAAWHETPHNGAMSPLSIAAAGGSDHGALTYLSEVLANQRAFV